VKSATLVTTLTSLTTAMAVAAPLVVFGFLYVLQVQPERAREAAARNELHAALADLERRRAPAEARRDIAEAAAVDIFVARAARAGRADDLAGAFTALLNGPAVGGVSNLMVETDWTGGDRARMTLDFDARYEQIVRFFRSLRALPPTVTLQAVELGSDALARTGSSHAKVSLLVGGEAQDTPQPASPRTPVAHTLPANTQQTPDLTNGRRPAVAPQPDPVVSSILISDGRRLARVDGRIVGPGDRLAAGVVQAIEPDAIVVAGPDGRSRRVEILRPDIELRAR
jgi:hypothetical protein